MYLKFITKLCENQAKIKLKIKNNVKMLSWLKYYKDTIKNLENT